MNSFLIYNASAGSGKTYTLVKSYVIKLLQATAFEPFKHILAITFTNKATLEMKTRILNALIAFSKPNVSAQHANLLQDIIQKTGFSKAIIQKKSKQLINTILNNYGAFDISTIDAFNHKLIRTFAFDLRLPLNFEVELDTKHYIAKAVDAVIDNIGVDKAITKTLLEFMLFKTQDDKSWDITYDLNAIAEQLLKENNLGYLKAFENKSLKDFTVYKTTLKKQIESLNNALKTLGLNGLSLIKTNHLEASHFKGKYLFNFFEKLCNGNFNINFEAAWIQQIETKPLYKTTENEIIKQCIDSLLPKFINTIDAVKNLFFKLKMLENIYKNITPLSTLNIISKALINLKKEDQKLFISDFNNLISNEIKNQPTPFIYERIGEKFKHYFIDEFQDTSILQWENLQALIENTLSQQQGSAMLVGDAKQAIYRWRGGKAEQFIGLSQGISPFVTSPKVKHLETNYRSFEAIVNFNNTFFDFVANTLFNNTTYYTLYSNAKQATNSTHKGFVSLDFLTIEDKDIAYPEQVYKTIKTCLANNYRLQDICVLVRKNNQGVTIANYLSNLNIAVTSPDSLLLKNNTDIVFLINLLTYIQQPFNKLVKAHIITYLTTYFKVDDTYTFTTTFLQQPIHLFFKNLKAYSVNLSYNYILLLPLYDLIETLVRAFNLVQTSNAYIQCFLDEVFNYSIKKEASLQGFLDYYNTKKETLSINTPENLDAVKIMTIHKAKGLEFPVVIFPYANQNIYSELKPKEWLPINTFKNVTHTLVDYNKDFKYYSKEAENIDQQHQNYLELDNINLLYVALTRAVEQLYIISEVAFDAKGNTKINTNTFSGIFINYLINKNLWNKHQHNYSFGELSEKKLNQQKNNNSSIALEFISVPKETHKLSFITSNSALWETKQEEAINKGNLIHLLLSKIYTYQDIEKVLQDALHDGFIENTEQKEIKQTLLNIVTNNTLKPYFKDGLTVYNERPILLKTGNTLIPDRLVLINNKAIIIDYKTGTPLNKHKMQLHNYENALLEMQIKTAKKLLVYITNVITIEAF